MFRLLLLILPFCIHAHERSGAIPIFSPYDVSLYLPYNPTIIHIGAAAGARVASDASMYPHGKVIAFEPQKSLFQLLQKCTQKYPNVIIVNQAVYETDAELPLYVPPNQKNASLLEPNDAFWVKEVSTVNLQDWCHRRGIYQAHLLWLTTNGSEYQILKCAPQILDSAVVVHVQTYFNDYWDNPKLWHLFALMEHHGFVLLTHHWEKNQVGHALFLKKRFYEGCYRRIFFKK
ncbi:MAG: FkbM family methyltransferase [Simkaniaceae bacterium]|nr:FkbM family methyltransferase [Simkaniaceae bacterium]